MSGGFFRGTSADQDTRFSNKQAKLLKSQKFAPELDHLVDITKVNMEVMKPWITRRVTELLGFEDEVLINFINSLLDAKGVNGKEIQIQITGFMEKNTGKFMKELWTLLLSAQKNASGVPQQFLDAKEEELLKKKAENDWITNEIQRKKDKEGREIMEERLKKLDREFNAKVNNDTVSDPTLKPRDSGHHVQDGKETDRRNGVRARNRSPNLPATFTSPHRGSSSRSMSKSFSNSRSYSGGRHMSRSVSRSPRARGRSLSSEKIPRSSRRRSISPGRHSPRHRRPSYSRRSSSSDCNSPSPVRHRMHSPSYRRSPSFRRRRTPSPVKRRRSPSPVRRRRSPSPVRRHRSPFPVRRHRSPSPVRRHRSPSPVRRRRSPSPVRRCRTPSPLQRHRTPSPVRRRRTPSPAQRCRSPSPIRRRWSPSPLRKRSPVMRHGSPSPLRKRSPVMRHGSPSPMRRIPPTHGHRSSSPIMQRCDSRAPQCRSPSPLQSRSPVFYKKRSASNSPRRPPSQDEWSSQSPIQHVSQSSVRRSSPRHQSPVQSSVGRVRVQKRLSPETDQPSSPFWSVQRDKNGKALRYKSPDSMSTPKKSPIRPVSPQARSRTSSKNINSHVSPLKQKRERLTNERSLSPPKKMTNQKPTHDIPETSEGAEESYNSRGSRDPKSNSSQKKSRNSPANKQRGSPARFPHEVEFYPEKAAGHLAYEYNHYGDNDWSKKGQEIKCDKSSLKGGESPGQQKSPMKKEIFSGETFRDSYTVAIKKSDDMDQSRSEYAKISDPRHKAEVTQDLVGKVDCVNQSASHDSVSEESSKHRREEKGRRKHKRSEEKIVSSDENFSYDSELEGRKEAKKRKKEEKKLRKEEKRRKREERRHRREERRTEKLKMKSKTNYISDDGGAERMDDHQSDHEETPYDPKKLEIELRNKALESLKAKRPKWKNDDF